MIDRSGLFRRKDRLLHSREFRNVLQRGRRTTARAFVVFALPRDTSEAAEDGPRLGITVSRRVGNAVARNHVKRRVREWFRHERTDLDPQLEIVVIGRTGAADLSCAEVAGALDLAADRGGMRLP